MYDSSAESGVCIPKLGRKIKDAGGSDQAISLVLRFAAARMLEYYLSPGKRERERAAFCHLLERLSLSRSIFARLDARSFHSVSYSSSILGPVSHRGRVRKESRERDSKFSRFLVCCEGDFAALLLIGFILWRFGCFDVLWERGEVLVERICE